MQFNLNCWLDTSTSPFVEMPTYDECQRRWKNQPWGGAIVCHSGVLNCCSGVARALARALPE